MTSDETRTRLREVENRLGEPTPPPIEGQTRIALPSPTQPNATTDDGHQERESRQPGRAGARAQ
ncbi:hypothetical protein ACF1BN_21035 [Streptomyces sp. NPDC014861]|uniref:hypothetical protein n=1 Tax=Streptomyces sp. NPDC014861 TaxID=3364923 RepID=UPI0036F4EC6B